MSLREALRAWRGEQSQKEGVEVFRVLPNAVLDSIVHALPQTKEELLAIKGIKEAKFRKYGKALLAIVEEYGAVSLVGGVTRNQKPVMEEVLQASDAVTSYELPAIDALSVSQFLDGLNLELSGMAARIKGEVSSVDERERVVYFTLKDSQDESTLNCLIFRYQYQLSGVRLSIGDEVIIEGSPDIYKPSGRLSLKVGLIELAGEGALKKAYDELFRKLEREGLLTLERKRSLPEFPERIALITSEQGAAIGDFTMNLGQLGLHVDFYPVSVEGQRAVPDILRALRYFREHADHYDLLVMIRGGGSLESLQAFNNEMLVHEVAACPIPTLLGIGHEKDITLAALVADTMVSTPTAAARTLREPFERARQAVEHASTLLWERSERFLSEKRALIERAEQMLALVFPKLKERFVRAEQELWRSTEQIRFVLLRANQQCMESEKLFIKNFSVMLDRLRQSLSYAEEKLREYDPKRVLSLGYALVRSGGVLVRSVTQVKTGDRLSLQVRDGTIEAEVR